jgi:hypothetical protein
VLVGCGTGRQAGNRPSFPAVIDLAMESLQPPPAGLEAPDGLPPAPAAVSAETSGLGGTYSTTLIATRSQEPVNSPGLATAASNLASDLGTFSTTAVSSSGSATSYVGADSSEDVAPCSGTSAPVRLGPTMATLCQTDQGPAISWHVGPWLAQVESVNGPLPTGPAAHSVALWLARHALPSAGKGLISVSVTGARGPGKGASGIVLWSYNSDVYQVNAPGNGLAALQIAGSMRPWPGGSNGRAAVLRDAVPGRSRFIGGHRGAGGR